MFRPGQFCSYGLSSWLELGGLGIILCLETGNAEATAAIKTTFALLITRRQCNPGLSCQNYSTKQMNQCNGLDLHTLESILLVQETAFESKNVYEAPKLCSQRRRVFACRRPQPRQQQLCDHNKMILVAMQQVPGLGLP